MTRTLALTLALFALLPSLGRAAATRQDFDNAPGQTPVTRTAFGAGAAPRAAGGALRLLDGRTGENNAAAFNTTAPGRYARVEASWRMQIAPGGEGASFVLLPAGGKVGVRSPAPSGVAWDAPRLPGAFAVAFTVHDPPTDNPFNADGNIAGRPQREVALFWDGAEVARRLSPVEFRTTQGVPVQVTAAFVCGGANVSVRIAGVNVYADYFVPDMVPYPSRAAFGGRTGKKSVTRLTLRDVDVTWQDPVSASPAPLVVPAMDGRPLDKTHHSQSQMVTFPADTDGYGRILCRLTLSRPPGGYDAWDRQASVYAYAPDGERFEIVRFITPYGRGFTWNVDVSDYRPLLRGPCRIEAQCGTYGNGWITSVSFRFYPGHARRLAYRVMNLWHGEPTIGDPAHPISAFWMPQTVTRDPQADAVTLRFVVTGHGQAPNTGDAAEFLATWRYVGVNGMHFPNLLWKTDNYLNPCSPQGGTWKYDRAGWGPGTVVTPWDIDATPWMPRGAPSVLTYQESPYLNKTPDPGNNARHWVESQVIFFRKN